MGFRLPRSLTALQLPPQEVWASQFRQAVTPVTFAQGYMGWELNKSGFELGLVMFLLPSLSLKGLRP